MPIRMILLPDQQDEFVRGLDHHGPDHLAGLGVMRMLMMPFPPRDWARKCSTWVRLP